MSKKARAAVNTGDEDGGMIGAVSCVTLGLLFPLTRRSTSTLASESDAMVEGVLAASPRGHA